MNENQDLILEDEEQLVSARIPKSLKHRLDIAAAIAQRQLKDIISEAIEEKVAKLENAK